MTVIAVRNRIMAADSLCMWNGMRTLDVKIIRKDGWLTGGSGSLVDIAALRRWYGGEDMLNGQPPKFVLYGDAKPDADLLMLTPEGRIFFADCHGLNKEINLDFFAIGSGEQAAMAAMYMGADARTAVEIAIKVRNDCGGPVQVEEI